MRNQWNRTPKEVVGKTESFGFRNVKTITFLVVIALFLCVFIPVGVIGIQDFIDFFDPANKLPEMTLEDVAVLSEKDAVLFLEDVSRFRGKTGEWTIGLLYTVEIGEDYILRAVASHVDQRLESCVLTNLKTGDEVDVLKDDVRAFLREQEQK